jgi:hypothetical protein
MLAIIRRQTMSREKQIEELTNELVFTSNYGTYNAVANYLVNKGYRKQEWISVEERLPECDTNVLVITVSGSFKIARVNIYKNGTVVLWATNDGLGERAITHWMPLPEAPKGGAE